MKQRLTYLRNAEGYCIWNIPGVPIPEGFEKISKADYEATQIKTAFASLRKRFPPGKTHSIYALVRSVSKSGMQRDISLFVVCTDTQELHHISYDAEKVLGWGRGKLGGVKVNGCGMDMCFHLVHALFAAINHGAETPTKFELKSL